MVRVLLAAGDDPREGRMQRMLAVVFLLGPKADRAWRLAMLAGAFEAVPAGAPEEAALQAVRRALAYTVGRVVGELSTGGAIGGREDQPFAPGLVQTTVTATRSR